MKGSDGFHYRLISAVFGRFERRKSELVAGRRKARSCRTCRRRKPSSIACLSLAQVKKGDVVYDLGSGDGRIVVTAAKKYGVKAIGFEIDPQRIKESA